MNSKNKMYALILLEIQDAKIKAFDKILYAILKEQASEKTFTDMNDLVLETYGKYKKDVQKILEMYISAKYTNDPSMVSFLEKMRLK